MPRKPCRDAPGELHHIITRGIERQAIFKDVADRENFLDQLFFVCRYKKDLWLLTATDYHQ